jgi:hypothetical protein
MDVQTLTDIKQINSHMRISKMEPGRQIKTTWKNSKKWGLQNMKEKYTIDNIENSNMSKKWKKEYIKIRVKKDIKKRNRTKKSK